MLLPGGGFPRGALSELVGGPASGKMAIALATLARGMGERGLAAFVDGRCELYPPAARALGVDLERLLVVRPCAGPDVRDRARAGLWAAEAVLASGAFDAVAIEVPLGGRARHAAPLDPMLRRVRAAAEKGGAVALWLGAPGEVRVPAAVRLELSPAAGGWQVRRSFAHGAEDVAAAAVLRGAHHAA
jgi:protein ImuA